MYEDKSCVSIINISTFVPTITTSMVGDNSLSVDRLVCLHMMFHLNTSPFHVISQCPRDQHYALIHIALFFALALLTHGYGHIFQELHARRLHFHCPSLLFRAFCARTIAVSIEDHVAASADVFLYIAHLRVVQVGDRQGKISRSKVDGHVQYFKPAIPNRWVPRLIVRSIVACTG